MAVKTISNPAGLWGLTADVDGQLVMECQNNSGGARTPGDLVVIDVTGTLANTTTTANDKTVIGVVAAKNAQSSLATAASTDTYAAGAIMPVIVLGPARINIGANTVAAGDPLTSSTTAAQAQTNVATITTAMTNNAFWGSVIAIAMEANAAKDANNTIRAYIAKM